MKNLRFLPWLLITLGLATITFNSCGIKVDSITLDQQTLTLAVAEDCTLTAIVLPDDAADKTVTWTSSADSIATVSDGKITAISQGTVTITAGAGDQTATCIVMVTAPVDEEGLTEDIRNIIPDKYIKILKKFGFQINGGNTPPNLEGYFLADPLELVDKNFGSDVAFQKDMYLTLYEQNNIDLTIKVNYNVWCDYTGKGDTGNICMEVNGLGSFIVGEGNKFTIFAESIRTNADGNSKAKTVEAFSGEITANGIKDYQWAVIMIDNGDGNNGKWIKNGNAYVKKDGDGLAVYIEK